MIHAAPQIWLIGAGRMGTAMLMRWLASGMPPECLTVINRNPDFHTRLKDTGVTVLADISQAHTVPDIIVLAIKPQQFREQFPHLKAALGSQHTVLLSVMAGVPARRLADLGEHLIIVRAMPNTPSEIGEGVTALFADNIDAAARAQIDALMTPLGTHFWCAAEDGLHDATAISGSGSAYVFLFLQALKEAAIALGMPEREAHASALATVKGAALLAAARGDDFTALADQVTSKHGTTRMARDVLDARLKTLMIDTTKAARMRSVGLEKEAENSA